MKTEDIIKELSAIVDTVITEGNSYTIEKNESDSEHFTESVLIKFIDASGDENPRLFICGFITDDDLLDSNDWSKEIIEYVELTDGEDCDGGLNYDEGDIVMAYHKIKKFFKSLGYEVVKTSSNYF